MNLLVLTDLHLTSNRYAGRIFDNGTNYAISKKSPNITETSRVDEIDLNYYLQQDLFFLYF